MGIALLTMSALEVFSQTGFERALVQKKENIKSYLDTAWTVSVIRGILISALLFISAPLIAVFFHSPNVVQIIQVIAISQFFSGLTNVGVVYFQKNLEFKKQFIYQLSGTVADVIVAVSLAFILQNVWAIVYGLLAGTVVRVVMSYIVHPYRPGFNFDLKKAKELFEFGGWIFVSSILVFLLTQGDDALVGKVLGVTALGFYTMAYRFSNLPATEIAHVVSRVTFPAYSKLQNEQQKLKEAYLKVLEAVIFISIPLAGVMFILAPEVTKIFLGEKWIPMVPTMRVLCIFGAVRSIQNTYGALYAGVGKPNLVAKVGGIELAVLIAIIYPLTVRWNIFGTALSTVIAITVSSVVGMFYVQRIIKFNYSRFVKIIFISLIGVVGFSVFASLMKNTVWYSQNIGWFLGLMISTIIIYLMTVYLLSNKLGVGGFFKNLRSSL
jgi:O-antigen/teichoic acid export membrane protein